jgi:hypothetical protein
MRERDDDVSSDGLVVERGHEEVLR